jgi:maleate isomerase
MTKSVRLGMLTPSSNTVLEPGTGAMLAGLSEASAHFGRFRVTEISLSEDSRRRFDLAPILEAARLARRHKGRRDRLERYLGGTARVRDRRPTVRRDHRGDRHRGDHLDARPERGARGLWSLALLPLVTSYLGEIQERIVLNYRSLGLDCVAERHLRDPGNSSFALVSEEAIAAMIHEFVEAGPQAIANGLHQPARGAAGRGARAGGRRADPRYRLGGHLEVVAPGRGRPGPGPRLGRLFRELSR